MKFSISRFTALIQRDWIIYKRPILLVLAALPLLVFLICYIQGKADSLDAPFVLNWFGIFLLLGGAIFTSTIMWEFGKPISRKK